MTIEIKKRVLSWDEINALVDQLVTQLPTAYDILLVITRGGMIPACLLSERMDMRNIVVAAVRFYTAIGETQESPEFLQFPTEELLSGKRVLIVDDVWDSGRTAMAVRERVKACGAKPEIAVLHYKPVNSHFPSEAPDYWADEVSDWIVYPWDAER